VEAIRARTAVGTLHLETNGSSAVALRRVIAAGLDSVAIRVVSARAETYERLHAPEGYRFSDVRASIEAAVTSSVGLALVILVLPGLTDRPAELDAIARLAGELPPGSQLVFRDLACDPRPALGLLRVDGPPLGIANALARIRSDAPELRLGALVRPLARV
jgi:pyruvate-formate lyase-activating enzyme